MLQRPFLKQPKASEYQIDFAKPPQRFRKQVAELTKLQKYQFGV